MNVSAAAPKQAMMPISAPPKAVGGAKDADGDNDGSTSVKSSARPAPSVNTQGQTVGSTLHVTA